MSAMPPAQPRSGPGGRDYLYSTVTVQSFGTGPTAYTLVMPVGAAQRRLPVVYFLHGYGTLEATPYISWLEHLARKGTIVIYPAYQVLATTRVREYTPNAVQAIRDALVQLESGGGARPDVRRVAAIGHSLGGAVAANLAAVAGSSGIPVPKALMTINPSNQSPNGLVVMPMEDLSQVAAGTLQQSLYSDADSRVSNALARRIFVETTSIPLADKDYIIINSDRHGSTALNADHFAALAGRASRWSLFEPDALDFYGYWRLADALLASAFTNTMRDIALGGGSLAQRDMGIWSDGTPVRRLTVTDLPY